MANELHFKDLFSSLISDIKTYKGKDPLLPWLQGIRKMKESLPPHILKEKLPRFLQKCALTFESDRHYRNDLRYLRVWVQLMDFVDDPKMLLRTMEKNRIGTKLALYYQAYALYFEKHKKFEESEKMYHLGVQNLAEPAAELHKSYEQFLLRMKLYEKRMKRRQQVRASLTSRGVPCHHREMNLIGNDKESATLEIEETTEKKSTDFTDTLREKSSELSTCDVGIVSDSPIRKDLAKITSSTSSFEERKTNGKDLDKSTTLCGEDTVVVKFVGSAIVGKRNEEDACHHGLVDPTINMKEAMNTINNMFREPLEAETKDRRSQRSRPKVNHLGDNGFEVFIDESLENEAGLSNQKTESDDLLKHNNTAKRTSHFAPIKHLKLGNQTSLKKHTKTEMRKPQQGTFKIFVDDGDNNEGNDGNDEVPFLESRAQHPVEDSNCSDDPHIDSSPQVRLRDDTVVCRFVGSTIFGESEVENACHHGLVDPTINMKQAMDDINSMFGKPLDLVKTNKKKKRGRLIEKKQNISGFTIFAEETLEKQPQVSSCSSHKLDGEFNDLFEPTVFTKEAMDEINEMFGMPLEF
ncbi:mad3/BUB1 homology region 1 isoform X2 [Tasmannia lanceolata]|uniref:mad3/BUB1 homology region 1 isoform X2 n=1 Tax=Tasmannia lanceolata TaxID=3420 RepID=UPI004063157F